MSGIIKVRKQEAIPKQLTTITDIISLELLQELQNKFALTNNVSSIIIDIHGNTVTKPSNFSKICILIQETELGRYQCNASDQERKRIANKIDHPTYLKCHPCGFADASIPVFINGKRVANWLVGQVNLNDSDRNEIIDYASVIGVDIAKMLTAFDKMPKMSSSEFESVIKLLSNIASEIMDIGFKAHQSENSDKTVVEEKILNRFNNILGDYKK